MQTRAFDLDGRQSSYPYTATGTVSLTYDLGNRIKNLTGTVAKTYGYDKLDRLTSYSNEIYAYDADGNRSSHTVGATNYPYTYPSSSNRLTSFTGPAARSYTYDASGNTLTTSSGYAFTYDARGRMTNITTGSVNQYGINALGQRLTQAGTGYTGTQRYVYSEEGKLLGEYDNTGALITEHVYLSDTPIAAMKAAGAYLVQADHLNTPRAILGAANALVWKWASDAFGTTAANENPSALGVFNYNLRFPGQYYDKESAFNYNYYRDHYNPKTGRYLQSDPIGLAGGINTYAYVGSNPTGFRDPLGLNPYAGAVGGAEIGSFAGPVGTVVGGIIGAVGGYIIADKLSNVILNNSADKPVAPQPALPAGWDGSTPPAPGCGWSGPDAPGGENGAWVSPDGSQSLHPDFDHPAPIGPHVDWNIKRPKKQRWRIFPDGSCKPK